MIPLPRYNEEKSLHFLFYSSDCQEAQSTISKLRGSKATKLDFIDLKKFKAVSKEISPCLVHVINLSIKTKTVPDIYKHAKVVPILKCDPELGLEKASLMGVVPHCSSPWPTLTCQMLYAPTV